MRQLVATIFIITFLTFSLIGNEYTTGLKINGKSVMKIKIFGSTISKSKFTACQTTLLLLGIYFLATGEIEFWILRKTGADNK